MSNQKWKQVYLIRGLSIMTMQNYKKSMPIKVKLWAMSASGKKL